MRIDHALLRHSRAAAAFGALLALSLGATAQVSATHAVDSDYRFRGVSLSDSRPSLQLTANYDAASGWYAGVSATQVGPATGDRYAQLFGYAGYAMPVAEGHSIEFGATYAHFTGDASYDYAEAYVGVLFQQWSLRLHLAPDYFRQNVRTAYLDVSAQWPLNEHASLFGHVGVLAPLGGQGVGGSESDRARADLRVGVGWVFGDVDLRVALVTVSPGGPYPAAYGGARTAWVFGATYAF